MATNELASALKHTLAAAQAKSTRRAYTFIEKLLLDFHHSTGLSAFPGDEHTTALFVQFLSRRYKYSSIRSHLSALSYKYKMASLKDPTSSFIVRQAVQGLERLNPSADTRSPISLPILGSLLNALSEILHTEYSRGLFKAMFTTAFYGLLRIGEFTSGPSDHTISLSNVHCHSEKITIMMSSFKHSTKATNRTVVLNRQNSPTCPVYHMLEFLRFRPQSKNHHLFIHQNGSSVSRKDFLKVLNLAVSEARLEHLNIRSHSFRIGGACLGAALGLSDTQLRLLGRWRSNAFTRYLREK